MDLVSIVISAVLGFAAALGGSAFQAHLQRKTTAEERSERRKETLRSKAEEIYQEVEAMFVRSCECQVYAIKAVNGDDNLGPRPLAENAAWLRALLRMYFPASREFLEDYAAKSKLAGEIMLADAEARPLNPRAVYHDFTQAIHRLNSELVQNTRSFMDAEVKGLL